MWDQLRSIPKSSLFSQLDLSQGYHQLKIHEDDKKYTCFITEQGKYQYTRVPFGLTNAPRVFQRVMRKILQGIPYVKVFLDDILIFSSSFEEHLFHLEKVLLILKNNNISINFKKSNFIKKEVSYLGHIISEKGIRPDEKKIKDIKMLTPPKSIKQLQRLLGYLNWYREFIPNLSFLLQSITEKIKKKNRNERFTWTQQDQEIIDKIFSKIKEQIILSYPDYTKPFQLNVDASNLAIGAILYQEKQIIGIFSQKLLKSQLNYTVCEKEMYAIIKSIEHFKKIIFDSKVIIKTDNRNITYNKNITSSRIERWKILLEEYNVELQHTLGENNKCADYLSRNLVVQENKMQKASEIINLIADFQEKKVFDLESMIVGERKLYFTKDSKIIIPEDNNLEVLDKFHYYLGHASGRTMYKTLKPYFTCREFLKTLIKLSNNCAECQKYKTYKHNYALLKGKISTNDPMKHLSTDVVGPFFTKNFQTTISNKRFFLLTISDRCSRYSKIYLLENLEPTKIINKFKEWFKEFGVPETVLSDQGKYFIAKRFINFLDTNKIKPIKTTIFNPTGNSISERLNQKINLLLSINKHSRLKSTIQYINDCINITHNRNLKASPHEVIHQYAFFDFLKKKRHNLQLTNEIAKENNLKDLKRLNKNRIKLNYKEGDQIYVKNYYRKEKLDAIWLGPFRIKEANSDYVVFCNKKKLQKANVKNIRPVLEG